MAKTLLVVDDSRTVTTAVSWMLRNAQWTVLTASASDEARDLIRTHDPDVVLIDYHLPDGSGLDLCRALKADPGTQARIVILGGTWHPFDPSDSADAGAHGHLMKPFRSDALVEALQQALDSPGPEEETLLMEPVEDDHGIAPLDALDDDLLDLDDESDLLILTAEHDAVETGAFEGELELPDEPYAAPLPIERSATPPDEGAPEDTTGEHAHVLDADAFPDVILEDEPAILDELPLIEEEEERETTILDEIPLVEEKEEEHDTAASDAMDDLPLLEPLPTPSPASTPSAAADHDGTAPMPAALRQGGGVVAPPPARTSRSDAGLLRTPASLPRPAGLRGVAGPLGPPPPSRPQRSRVEPSDAPVQTPERQPTPHTETATSSATDGLPEKTAPTPIAADERPEATAEDAAAAATPAAEAVATPAPELDRDVLRALVKEALPNIVREVLSQLLKEHLAERTDAYAQARIDAFVEKDLPGLAERKIESFLDQSPE